MQKKQFTNHLIHETSPYLLQHAHNPVNWYAWNSEALTLSNNLDKPILLSIGYSACHWCHVMAHESFENTDIATIMNDHFINIKVDREERPDLDDIYMTSVQLMTGRGGWPMTVFLTPDLEPFYGGTYFPPVDRMGIPGFPQILNSVAEYYKEHKHKIKNDTAKLKSSMHHISNIQKADEKTVLDKNFLTMTAKNILSLFDTENGGFGLAPKFPQSMTLKFLMRMYLRTKDPTMLEAIDISLLNMACGGIYDHLGGGFHRYAVDAEWQVPHFEKMLYDNALLASCYLEGYTLTHRLLFKQIAIETLDYCLREMQDSEGGFYSAQDADSEGEEGKYFVWTQAEIYKILGKEEGQLFSEYFQINQFGNFEKGYSTLHRVRNEDLFLKKHNLFKNSWDQKVKNHKQLLLEKRLSRPSPSTDKKILTSWNALLVSALIKAYYITQERRFLIAAQKTIEFIQDHLIFQKNRLYRTCKDGVSKINGYLEDYSLFLSALLDIYEVTGNSDYFSQALRFNEIILQQFWDKNNGAFFFTSSDHELLLLRSKNIYDNATPSGNSIQVMNLLRLYKITGKTELLDKAETTLKAFLPYMASSPSGFSEMLCALDFYFGPVLEIAIINPATQTKIANLAGSEIAELFIPNKVMAICQMENEHHPDVVLLKNKSAMNNQPTFYLCQNFTCQNPTTNLQELKQSITANLNTNKDLDHADRKTRP